MSLSIVRRLEVGQASADHAVLAEARQALESQAAALEDVARRLSEPFCRALDLILACRGRVVVCGVGKSGLIGRKLAATLASTGTPSVFLHAAEAAHGDLGMVTRADVVLIVSNSGSTEELVWLLPQFQALGVPIIAMVGNTGSAVAQAAAMVIDISVEREICPHDLVPTTSTLATLAVGDALAIAAMNRRGFSAQDFARVHPRGALGRKLNRRVSDVMRRDPLPVAAPDVSIREALLVMTAGRSGLVVLVDAARHPLGIITDGDLRRGLQSTPDLLERPASELMTAPPITIRHTAWAREANERMRRYRVKALVAVDAQNQMVGVVEIFDD
jgi:arabinose-5-phosphate isomerase